MLKLKKVCRTRSVAHSTLAVHETTRTRAARLKKTGSTLSLRTQDMDDCCDRNTAASVSSKCPMQNFSNRLTVLGWW